MALEVYMPDPGKYMMSPANNGLPYITTTPVLALIQRNNKLNLSPADGIGLPGTVLLVCPATKLSDLTIYNYTGYTCHMIHVNPDNVVTRVFLGNEDNHTFMTTNVQGINPVLIHIQA